MLQIPKLIATYHAACLVAITLTCLLVQLGAVGDNEVTCALGCTGQAVVQRRLVHGLDLWPMQVGDAGQFDVFGYYPFGDAKAGGDVLV